MQKIRPGNLTYQRPWGVTCSICRRELRGHTTYGVLADADRLGWKYDEEKDMIYCKKCLKDLEKNL